MPKKFNVTGLCIPKDNYMVDISERIDTIITDYVQEGKYFTINRTRQYGKTTLLYLLEQRLKEEYFVIRFSFEASDELFVSLHHLAAGLIRKVSRILKAQGADQALVEKWNQPVSEIFPFDDLSERISALCSSLDRKIVLIIDEVDKNSDNQIFLSFLGLLRNKYLEQRQRNDCTFQSVILAGVYDVKNLKLKLHPGQESKYNSPWNIAADFTVNMAFMPEDIATMLREYEQDHHTGMDIMDMVKQIYDYTCGYPFLVSRLCMLMDEIIVQRADFGVIESVWTQNGLTEAVKELLVESNTLFDDMLKKLDEYPELKKMLYGILFNGEKIPYNADTHVINIGVMF